MHKNTPPPQIKMEKMHKSALNKDLTKQIVNNGFLVYCLRLQSSVYVYVFFYSKKCMFFIPRNKCTRGFTILSIEVSFSHELIRFISPLNLSPKSIADLINYCVATP